MKMRTSSKSILSALLALAVQAGYAQNTVKDSTGLCTSSADNILELLRGQISSVRVSSIDGNPVGALNINIRGLNSLRTDNLPLFVIDGAILNTGLNQTTVPLTSEVNLVAALGAYDGVDRVDFTPVWGVGRTLAERSGKPAENFVKWVCDICKTKKSK